MMDATRNASTRLNRPPRPGIERLEGRRLFAVDALSLAAGVTPAATGNGGSDRPGVSADGRFVAFDSTAANLVAGQADPNNTPTPRADVFLYDRSTGTNVLASHNAASATTTGNGPSLIPSISADGRFVAFEGQATDVVPGQVTP